MIDIENKFVPTAKVGTSKLFENTETAFRSYSFFSLFRGVLLFTAIQSKMLVNKGAQLLLFLLENNVPVKPIIKSTVYNHFCGGVTLEDCQPTLLKIANSNSNSILDYAKEGVVDKDQFDKNRNEIFKCLEFATQQSSVPFVVFKPTALGRFAIYEKVTANQTLELKEQEEWKVIKERFYAICKRAIECNISILVDAEESWIQGAIDDLVLQLMSYYNKDKVFVYNTLQFYRKDRLKYLELISNKAKMEGFRIGVKIVRGAYMEKESKRAKTMGYENPICKSKVATDELFNRGLIYMINNLETIAIYVGTHNEESCYLMMHLMRKMHIPKNTPLIWFGQLYGMSDHITYNLSKEGYNTTKYLPYGSVKEAMPYLIRRAQENSSVKGQSSRELQLLKKEVKRRLGIRS